MYKVQQPEVGSWYVNRTGKLLKVKLLVYRHEDLKGVLLEYLDGSRQTISLSDWNMLELNKNLQEAATSFALQ